MNKKEMKMTQKLEKQRIKESIREEKERRRNSFGHKIKSFFATIIFVIILLIVAFFGAKYYINQKLADLYNEEMAYYYDEAENYRKSGEYEKAIIMYNKVEEGSLLYEDAQKQLETTIEIYIGDYITASENYIELKEYDKAISIFDELSEELRLSDSVQEAIAKVYIAKIEDKIADETSLPEKIIIIQKEISDNFSDVVKNCINELLDEQIALYVVEVKSDLSAKTYSKYIEEIEKIEKVLENNSEIKSLKEEVENYKPQDLLSLTYEKEEETIVTSIDTDDTEISDTKSQTYTSYILVNESKKSKENTITWNLDEEYSVLSGKVCLTNLVSNITSSGVKITIYGDGKAIYKSKKIKKGTGEFNFSVDITGVKKLKIVLESDIGISYMIANPTISK